MLKDKNAIRGFTLIELLVVISIIGVLSTIAMTSLNGARVKAREAKMLSTLDEMDKAANLDFATYGTWSPDVGPSGCSCSCYSGISHPRFIADGIFPAANYDDVRWYRSDSCFDYQNWNGGEWISMDVYACASDCSINILHRKCIYGSSCVSF